MDVLVAIPEPPVDVIPVKEALQILQTRSNSLRPPPRLLECYPESGADESASGKQRRKTVKWTLEEQQFVINGYARFGPLWTEILKEYPFQAHRVHIDLRDKWTNIERHSTDETCARLFKEINDCRRERALLMSNCQVRDQTLERQAAPEMQMIYGIIREYAKKDSNGEHGHPAVRSTDCAKYPLTLGF
jgi:hypothetical protein